jgi:hypothetical protein
MTFKRFVLIGLTLAGLAAITGLYIVPERREAVEPITEKWEISTHSNANSLSFTFWDDEDPPLIPEVCAKCHSTFGYWDFLGEDGSTAREVDQPAQTGTTVYCGACHNTSAHQMTQVAFPSGAEITGLEGEAVCMQCHQGRKAGADVEQATANLEVDTVSEDLSFINVHYAIAAATWLGSEAQGGYQYPNRTYVTRFEHVPDMQTCVQCHDPHSQSVDPQACSPCHVKVEGWNDLADIRTGDADYDGDGDNQEGLFGEIETLQAELSAAMQAYASQVAGAPLAYALDGPPYYVNDINENGQADEDEVNFGNNYAAWTPRLLRAAYNYHFSFQDPGQYAHNGLYVLQLLYDSLDDLGQTVSVNMDRPLRPTSQ